MTDRRPMGALEAEVLGVLWDHDRALTPGEVGQAMGGELAYTRQGQYPTEAALAADIRRYAR